MSVLEATKPGAPLAAMAAYPQFLCWTVKQDIKTGRDYKVTVNPVSGRNCDSQDPANWMSAADACTIAEASPHVRGVGFVFTTDDPFVFVDIDKCLEADGAGGGGVWSPVAIDLMTCLTGAAVEVSQSGRGLHIFGKCAHMPHSCKNTTYGSECYTEGRFVALTGEGMVGDSSLDITLPMVDVIKRYFPERVAARDVSWSDSATHAKWAGPENDDELIQLALQSCSAAGAFATGATFRHLWECDEAALAQFYPDTYGDRAWDASNVDGALAMHLAFWTGGNHERIKRLMLTTDHVRDKWDRVAGYLEPTVSGAVSRQSSAYYSAKYDAAQAIENSPEVLAQLAAARAFETVADAPIAPVVQSATVDAGAPASEPVAGTISGSRFMAIVDQIEHFKNCIYVRDLHQVMIPGGALLDLGPFRVMYGGYNFALDATNQKTIKSAWGSFHRVAGLRLPEG